MKECIFYKEWLHLPKDQFNILAMIAASGGEFIGNLTDICNYLSVTPQSRNRNKNRMAIEDLHSDGWITWKNDGRTQILSVHPKATEISLPLEWVLSVIKHDYSGEPVAFAQVLKVFIWIADNDIEVITDELIEHDLKISKSTIGRAKKVLKFGYEIVKCELVSKKIRDDVFIRIGQKLEACAWWKDIT